MVTVAASTHLQPDASANRSWRRGHHSGPYWVTYKDVVNFAGEHVWFVQTDEANGFTFTPRPLRRT